MEEKEIYYNIGKNIKTLIDATERFNQLMEFLYNFRNYKKFETKIGTFKYEDWEHEIWCKFEINNDTPDFYFIEKDESNNFHKKLYRLTDLSFGWDFSFAIININFDIVDNYFDILSNTDKERFCELYDSIHSFFW